MAFRDSDPLGPVSTMLFGLFLYLVSVVPLPPGANRVTQLRPVLHGV